MSTQEPTLEAHFTNGGKRTPPGVTIYIREGNRRRLVSAHAVKDRADAKAFAKDLGATPWNF